MEPLVVIYISHDMTQDSNFNAVKWYHFISLVYIKLFATHIRSSTSWRLFSHCFPVSSWVVSSQLGGVSTVITDRHFGKKYVASNVVIIAEKT